VGLRRAGASSGCGSGSGGEHFPWRPEAAFASGVDTLPRALSFTRRNRSTEKTLLLHLVQPLRNLDAYNIPGTGLSRDSYGALNPAQILSSEQQLELRELLALAIKAGMVALALRLIAIDVIFLGCGTFDCEEGIGQGTNELTKCLP
jgi:hypothetical protein